MRRAAKVDANQVEIVAALRKAGCYVQSLAAIGNGCPDLLVGYKGQTILMEIKDGKRSPSERRLTADQQVWHKEWPGGLLFVVKSAENAINSLPVTP